MIDYLVEGDVTAAGTWPPGAKVWFQRAVVAGPAVMVGSSWGFPEGVVPGG